MSQNLHNLAKIQKLKKSIMSIISDNSYDLKDLKVLLDPTKIYIDNLTFVNQLRDIVEVILTDRDGNNKFTIKDLELLGDDIIAITSLVSGILLIIEAIPNINLRYDAGVTEELIFRVFAYVFLVIIPKETKKPWDLKEKEKVVELSVSIYQIIISSRVTQDAFEKIAEWFKKKGWCKCLSASTQQIKEEAVEKHLPRIKADIQSSVQKNKDKAKMMHEISKLKKQVKKLKSEKK